MSRLLPLVVLSLIACEPEEDAPNDVSPTAGSTVGVEPGPYAESLGDRSSFANACVEGRCVADGPCVLAGVGQVQLVVNDWAFDQGLGEAEVRFALSNIDDPGFAPEDPDLALLLDLQRELLSLRDEVPTESPLVDVVLALDTLGTAWDLAASLR